MNFRLAMGVVCAALVGCDCGGSMQLDGGSAGGASGGNAGGASGGTAGGIAGGASGGIAGGTSGGIAGGTSGGIAGGTSGGIAGGTSGGIAGGASGGIAGGASGGIAGGASGGSSGGASGGSSGGASGGSSGGASGGTASIVTGTLSIQAGLPLTNSVSVSLFVTGSSTAGTVTQMRLGNDGVLGAPQAFASNVLWTLAATDGTRTVNVELIDSTGATFSTSDTIILDRVAPFGSFIVLNGAEYTNNTTVPLLLTYTDANGMTGATVRIRIDGGAFSSPVPYATMLDAMLPAVDGLHTITLQVTDAAGNLAMETSRTITLDRVAPLVVEVNLLENPHATATNSRTPPMIAHVEEDRVVDAYCTVTTLGGLPATVPAPTDSCWRIGGGGRTRLAVTPQFPSDEQINRVTVFVRDAARNVGSGFREFTFDSTPPVGGAVVLTQSDAGFRNVSALATFGTYPPGVEVQVGINPSNGGTPDPALFIWSPSQWPSPRAEAEAANGSLVSFAVRFVDPAGNGGAMSNVVTNLRPRAAFQPILTLPTAESLKFATRVPLPGNGSRFIVMGGRDNTFSTDDHGVTWTKRDSLNNGARRGMAVTASGTVLVLNSYSDANGDTYFDVSADLGQFFRRSFRLGESSSSSSKFERPTFVAPRTTGGNDFAMLDAFGAPLFLSLDARNAPLELGNAATPTVFTDLAGCIGATYGGAIGINGNRIFRSRDSARTYEEMTPPVGFPATATLSVVGASGANVVIVAQRAPGVVTLLRETACGSGTWSEVTGLNFPTDRVPVALSVAGPDRAWVLSRSTTTEEVTISRVDFATSTALHLPWTPQARLNAIAGDTGSGVVVVGERGEIYTTGSFPSFASRRSRQVETMVSLSVRDGTPVAMAGTSSVVVAGGLGGRVMASSNAGATWVTTPVNGATGPMRVDATHQLLGGLAALELPGRLWLSPVSTWEQSTPMPAADPYRALTCYGPNCFAVGSLGAIAMIRYTGSAVVSSFEIAPVSSSTVDWHDVDVIEVPPTGPALVAVGTNGTLAVTRLRAAGATMWGPALTSPAAGVGLKRVAFQRDASGVALAIGDNDTLWRSPSFGAAFSTQVAGGLTGSTDLESLGVGSWVVAGGFGRLQHVVEAPSALRNIFLPTSATIVGVEVSDTDPDLIWVLAEDGAMFMSRVGLRQ